MNIYTIKIQNAIILKQDLEEEIIKNYLIEQTNKKNAFNIFYSFPNFNYPIEDIESNFSYALKNIGTFFKYSGENYSEPETTLFALFFALRNTSFNYSNSKKALDFIKNKFIEFDTQKEIVKWFQEEIKLYRLVLYSFDLEKFKDGTINKFLEENKEMIDNHKEGLIFD